MALVSYSDSEGSDDEPPKPKSASNQSAQTAAEHDFSVNKSNPSKVHVNLPSESDRPSERSAQAAGEYDFSIDKPNPRKIRVNLPTVSPDVDDSDGPPAPKRPRLGGDGLSGFNAMLPPPKRDQMPVATNGVKRKVFSLKTSAEPAFSREYDPDFDVSSDGLSSVASQSTPIETPDAPRPCNATRFKPLSVARNSKKKISKPVRPRSEEHVLTKPIEDTTAKTKISLFSTTIPEPDDNAMVDQADLDSRDTVDGVMEHSSPQPAVASDDRQPDQSLHDIASDLNLSAAAKRQLFGRGGKGGTAVNIVNFNTDAEYAANEQLRATGEQIQHNPVRGIAPGKHSLKQLMNSATLQKDALEESFAVGRRNKKEAGNKYGW